ncbi:MAG: hypothetical protein DRP42_00670 [Tenericutes bacterium]|nr:MAG: hypothetical protein DRP42_00670 [Mycoplasmatota bacterium]
MSDGNFFEKQAKVADGRFFRDMKGREDGFFNKAACKPMQKKAAEEDPVEDSATGSHRPTSDQPNELAAGGARFLQESVGAAPAAPQASNLNKKMQKKGSDLRFMGTTFEKSAKTEGSLGGDVTRDAGNLGGNLKTIGGRTAESGHRGARKAYSKITGALGDAADKVSRSDTLSLLALGLGGYGAAKLIGKGARGIAGLARRKPKKKLSMAQAALARIKGR